MRGFRFRPRSRCWWCSASTRTAGEAARLEEEGRVRFAQPSTDVAALAGKIESEIAQLPEDDRPFMDDLVSRRRRAGG